MQKVPTPKAIRTGRAWGLVFFLVLFRSFSFPAAQPGLSDRLLFERIQTEDGLSHSSVNSLAQDSSGYLWFGTQEGLVRYDGYSFTTYRYDSEDSTSLDNNRVETLYVTSDGVFWVGTAIGLNRYRPKTDDFVRFADPPTSHQGMLPGQVNDIVEAEDGHLWIGTQTGRLIRYDPGENHFRYFLADSTASEHLLDDQVRVLMFDRDGQLWIGTGEPNAQKNLGGGLLRFDPETGEVRRFRHRKGDPNSLLDDRVGALLQDRHGRIWIGTSHPGLHLYNPSEEKFTRFLPKPDDPNAVHAPPGITQVSWGATPFVSFLHEDRAGRLWIGVFGGGINVYDPKHQQLEHYQHEPGNPYSLNSNLVWSILEDNQGRVWVGSILGGLHKADPNVRKFQFIQHQPARANSLSSNDIMGLCASGLQPGLLWVGTRVDGLNRLNLESGKIKRFRHRPDDPHSLASNSMFCVYEDRSGTLWVGTNEGLSRFDRRTQGFEHFRHDPDNPNSLSTDVIAGIIEDSRGMLWVGTWAGGLNRWNRKDQEVTRYSFFKGGTISYENSNFVIHEDSRGDLWTATWLGGLYRYDPERDRFDEMPALRNIGAIWLYEDRMGHFWLGTQDRGLVCFDPATGNILTHYTVSDGLPSNTVYSILPDDQGFFWCSTNSGLCRLDPESGPVKSYDVSDGLPTNKFNFNGAVKTRDGYLLFGSYKGLVYFSSELKENTHPPQPYITRVRGLDQSAGSEERVYELRSVDQKRKITVPYSQRNLVFEYVALHYTNPAKNKYQYMLEPYDVEYIPAGAQRSARYTNLSPGDYTFRMKAANSDGYWSETPAELKVTILPPWWRTTLAYIGYALFIAGLLWLIYRILIDRERQRNEIRLKAAEAAQLREVDQMKSRFFANISHEFRTPLTLIQGPVRSLLSGSFQGDRKNQLRLILRNTERLRHLIDQLLELSQIESGKVQLETQAVDLAQFLRMTCSAYESLATSRQIDFHFQIPGEIIPVAIDTGKMEKVCFNLLSNAFKFTPEGGSVWVDLSGGNAPNEEIRIRVRDSGVGIEPEVVPHIFDRFYQADNSPVRSYEGSGIGLSLVREYIELHGGRVEVKSQKGRGTTFTILLPAERRVSVDDIHPVVFPSTEAIPDKESASWSDAAWSFEGEEDCPLVLIVEDNADMQRFLRQSIQDDFRVLQADNGKAGMELAQEQVPDLIISDVMMPEMDGFTLCRALREDPRTCHIPIILLTARAEAVDRLQGIEYGAEAYLTKPFDAAELKLRMRKLIEQRALLQQKYSRDYILRPAEVAASPLDEQFLQRLTEVIEEKMDDPDLSLDRLGKSMGMSRSQLYRKLKALTGESPGDFLRQYRLQKAAQLLKDRQRNISEVGYCVGFGTHSHFSKTFREYFGVTPSDYQQGV